jgi:hypothetical protein
LGRQISLIVFQKMLRLKPYRFRIAFDKRACVKMAGKHVKMPSLNRFQVPALYFRNLLNVVERYPLFLAGLLEYLT